MSKNNEIKSIILECPENILNRWDERARSIGINRSALILVGMSEYFELHPESIEEIPAKEIGPNQEIKTKSAKVKKKPGRPPKSPKPEKKTGKKNGNRKTNKIDGRKIRQEPKECPICHELIEPRGMGSHSRKHSQGKKNKNKNAITRISKETINRVRLYKKFDDVGIHGREDLEIPSQILVKGDKISEKCRS